MYITQLIHREVDILMQQNDKQEWRINDYRIVQTIGQGGYGTIYLAQGIQGQLFALKMVKITNNQQKQQIRKEGMLLASMEHPNILYARQFFFYDKEKYFIIVTDYCNKGSLDKYIGEFSQNQLFLLMKGIIEGMVYLHQNKQICHRDLKPQNILLQQQQNHTIVPKIADFGVAKSIEGSGSRKTLIGTQHYMAPQMNSGDYSLQVDIWALGLVFLQLLLGQRLYQVIGMNKNPAKMQSFPDNTLLDKITDDKMRHLVSMMLQKQPSRRITIIQVMSYFDNRNQQRNTISQKPAPSDRNIVTQCYIKTQEYWLGKVTLGYLRIMYGKYQQVIAAQAEKGNRKAQYLHGKMLQTIYGLQHQNQLIIQWYSKAYSNQQPHSCYELYLSSSSKSQRLQYLMNGKESKQVRCLYKLAEKYLQGGDGICIDYDQAYNILDELCKLKYPRAFYLKAKMHALQNTQFYKPQQVLQLHKSGALLGDLQCQLCWIQHRYKKKKDYREVLQLCIQAQKKQQISQEQSLYIWQIKAKSSAKLKQTQMVIQCYKKLDQIDGNNRQKDYLGCLAEYYQSVGLHSQAIHNYNIAINRLRKTKERNQFEEKRLKYLCQILYIVLRQQNLHQRAYNLLKVSASLGYELGKADQAYMIYMGSGVPKNQTIGVQLLKRLQKSGNNEAMSYLAIIQQQRKKNK